MSLYYFGKLHLKSYITSSYKEYIKSNILGYSYFEVQIKEGNGQIEGFLLKHETSNFSGWFLNSIAPHATMVDKSNAAITPDCLLFSCCFYWPAVFLFFS